MRRCREKYTAAPCSKRTTGNPKVPECQSLAGSQDKNIGWRCGQMLWETPHRASINYFKSSGNCFFWLKDGKSVMPEAVQSQNFPHHLLNEPPQLLSLFLWPNSLSRLRSLQKLRRAWRVITNIDSILKSRDITLPTKVCLVKAMVFPVVMYGCESWTVKKAECQRIDAFELWCWRRLLRVSWTARRSN